MKGDGNDGFLFSGDRRAFIEPGRSPGGISG